MAKIIVSLDVKNFMEAKKMVERLGDAAEYYKIGTQLFTAVGPSIVEFVQALQKKVFLDLKFHDIPNTVANAAKSSADMGVFMFNVHILGGQEMIKTAMEKLREYPPEERPLLIGVTVLTSHNNDDFSKILGKKVARIEDEVVRLALFAKEAGLDGVVASPKEIKPIKENCGDDFIVVAPGIRPASYQKADDQKRSMTPEEAVKAGADYLVIGRPIINAADPVKAIADIEASIKHL